MMVDLMGTADDGICVKANIMLSVVGDAVLPAEISQELGLTPSTAYAKGDEYAVPKVGKRRRSTGHWSLCTDSLVSSTDIADHARFILDKLAPHRDAVESLLANNTHQVSLSIWWEINQDHGCLQLSSEVVAGLAAYANEIRIHFIGRIPEEE